MYVLTRGSAIFPHPIMIISHAFHCKCGKRKCDRICEKGPNPAKLTFVVRPYAFVAVHVELGRLSDFFIIK